MRNLKKVLSLALALVMLLGMMVVGSSAAVVAYADSDSVTKDEAVEVMSGIGVFLGEGAGFNPQGGLNREQAAAIIARMRLGSAAYALTTAEQIFPDVVPGVNWSAPYITYCVSQGIITGRDDGRFDPWASVTGTEFAKMLLTALGYNSITQGYIGSGWDVNIQRDAYLAGLTTNVGIANMNAALTREQAAQMALNAEKANVVSQTAPIYANGVYIPGGKPETYAQTTGPDYAGDGIGNLSTAGTGATVQFCEMYCPSLKLDSTKTDDFGRPTNQWSFGDNNIISNASKGNAVKTYYNTVSAAKIAAALKGYSVVMNGETTATDVDNTTNVNKALGYVYNGTDQTVAAASSTIAAKINGLTGEGKIVEIYATGNTITKIVQIVKTVKEVTADVTTRVLNGDTQVSIPNVTSGYVDVDTLDGWQGVAKGDIVLTVAVDGVTYIEKAAVVTGIVASKTDTDVINVNGKDYGATGLSGNVNGGVYSAHSGLTFVDTYNFFLDNGGNIVAAKKVTNSVDTTTAVVLDIVYIANSNTITAGGASAGGRAEALLLNTDGTTQVKTVSSITTGGHTYAIKKIGDAVTGNSTSGQAATSVSIVAGVNTVYEKANASATTCTVDTYYFGLPATNESTDADAYEGKFYSYSANTDGTINLIDNTGSANNNISAATITPGVAKFAGASGPNGNANTVFLVRSGRGGNGASSYTYTAYTGVANVPKMTGASGSVMNNPSSTIARYVYLTGAPSVTPNTTIVYVCDGSYKTQYANSAEYRVYDVVIDGKETTLNTATTVTLTQGLWRCILTNGAVANGGATQLNAGGYFGGSVKAAEGNTLVLNSAVATNVNDGAVGLSVFNIDGNLKVYTIDLDKDGDYVSSAEGTVPEVKNANLYQTETVSVKTASGNSSKAEALYIIRKAVDPAQKTVVEWSLDKTAVTVSEDEDAANNTATVKVSVVGLAQSGNWTVACSGNTAATATATVSGDTITITGLAAGTTNVTVTLTLDSSISGDYETPVTQTIAVTVDAK